MARTIALKPDRPCAAEDLPGRVPVGASGEMLGRNLLGSLSCAVRPIWSVRMYWVAQQRIVAWLVAGIIPALVPNAVAPSGSAPTTQPAVSAPSWHVPVDDNRLDLSTWPADGAGSPGQPATSLVTEVTPAPPQPINNPLPAAFWSALSVFGLLGLSLGLRGLKAQLR